MTIYSLYIFDRHCTCIYYQDWHRVQRPRPAVEGNLFKGVANIVSPQPVTGTSQIEYSSPRNTLLSSSGVVVAVGEPAANRTPPTVPPKGPTTPNVPMSKLPFDEESKLVYGVIFSLKGMVQKLSGRDEAFVNYKTSSYKLHVFETLTGYKFVMFTDPNADSMRSILRQLYSGPFLEYVVRNPLIPMDSKEQGIDNEHFRQATDRYIRSVSSFSKVS
ncbi:snare-like protein [Serendipita vermifera]|nr:snare-like protein [Serendipita vermifera]